MSDDNVSPLAGMEEDDFEIDLGVDEPTTTDDDDLNLDFGGAGDEASTGDELNLDLGDDAGEESDAPEDASDESSRGENRK